MIGVDSSAEQIAAARARGLDARIMSGEALTFEGGFETVFSNAALHWMKRADAVIDRVWRALERGGRFVAEMGGAGNVETVVTALVAGLDRGGLDGRGRHALVLSQPRGLSPPAGAARLQGSDDRSR